MVYTLRYYALLWHPLVYQDHNTSNYYLTGKTNHHSER